VLLKSGKATIDGTIGVATGAKVEVQGGAELALQGTGDLLAEIQADAGAKVVRRRCFVLHIFRPFQITVVSLANKTQQ
jgi:hypothetical protein